MKVGADGVDWDALNKKNAQLQAENQLSPEEELRQAELRKKTFSYAEAEQFFLEVDLYEEVQAIQETKEVIEAKGLARICSCFKSGPKLNPKLSDSRDLIFALAKVKYDSRIAEHEIILKTIYKKLTATQGYCRSVGEHW